MNSSTQRICGQLAVGSVLVGLPVVLVVWFIKHRGAEVIHQILRWHFHFAVAHIGAALSVSALMASFLLVDWIAGPFHLMAAVGSFFRPDSSERSS
jgi:hypothetical protein